MDFERLPDHLLDRILSKLVDAREVARVRSVSHRFAQAAARVPTLCFGASTIHWNNIEDDVIAGPLICRSTGLQALSMEAPYSQFSPAALQAWAFHVGGTLKHLSLQFSSRYMYGNSAVHSLLLLKRLASLELTGGMFVGGAAAKDLSASPLRPRLPLQKLSLANLTLLDCQLAALLQSCPALADLRLDGLKGLRLPKVSSRSLVQLRANVPVDHAVEMLEVDAPGLVSLQLGKGVRRLRLGEAPLLDLLGVHGMAAISLPPRLPGKLGVLLVRGPLGEHAWEPLQRLLGASPHLEELSLTRLRSRLGWGRASLTSSFGHSPRLKRVKIGLSFFKMVLESRGAAAAALTGGGGGGADDEAGCALGIEDLTLRVSEKLEAVQAELLAELVVRCPLLKALTVSFRKGTSHATKDDWRHHLLRLQKEHPRFVVGPSSAAAAAAAAASAADRTSPEFAPSERAVKLGTVVRLVAAAAAEPCEVVLAQRPAPFEGQESCCSAEFAMAPPR